MSKKMLIDATHAEETRVVVVDGNKVEDFDFERAAKRQLSGNIYLAKVTRVEPSLQAAFVDYGGNRHGFLAFAEIHPSYYQIPVADREALLAEEMADAHADSDDVSPADEQPTDEKSGEKSGGRGRRVRRSRTSTGTGPRPAQARGDAVATQELTEGDAAAEPAGMEVIDLEAEGDDPSEGLSPMVTVAETPVETPAAEAAADDEDEDDTPDPAHEVETISADDSDDVRPVRKTRMRRYKIQEVIKVRQVMLVQVVKEERGNKGAALTTYLSLAGRYCVLMPNTARGGGISRKITNVADRKKLKEIAQELEVPQGAGLIIRTAGSQRTKAEIKRDYEYLMRLWEQIRALTLSSNAPAKIYEEGDLIKRSIRDLTSTEIDEVIVEGDEGFRTAYDFMKMMMPGQERSVIHYHDQMPLFARYQVEGYLGGMFNPVVQLPSGGYIVIGVTEALVAIDVNSGRATKEGSIEQTATKTNLEAADEIARQLRLRDLAGLIVIDFIDMDERKNNAAVEKRFRDKLKDDRARIQVGRISGFGLLEMSRQRLRPGMIEATTQPCSHCHGTGLLRSDDNLGLTIIRQLEEEGVRGRSREVVVHAPVGIVNFLMNQKREHIAGIEQRYGMSVRVEADITLVSPDYSIEKLKAATRVVQAAPAAPTVVTGTAELMEEIIAAEVIEDDIAVVEEEAVAAAPVQTPEGEDDRPRKKRRRRRRRRGNGEGNGTLDGDALSGDDEGDEDGDDEAVAAVAPVELAVETPVAPVVAQPVVAAPVEVVAEEAPAPVEKPKRRTRKKPVAEAAAPEVAAEGAEDAPVVAEVAEAVAEKPKRRTRSKKVEAPVEVVAEAAVAVDAEAPAPKPRRSRKKPVAEAAVEAVADAPVAVEAAPVAVAEPAREATVELVVVTPAPTPAPAAPVVTAEPEAAPDAAAKPKRSGWWSK
ncbi:Rne/Rng family ribonuclease [Ketogulonicigenium vulgare]|uniref:Rne/Rng family ribonuclease n=1 Tax=Ketogulonicigenium vulgare TaxID=92945 RepID=UPI0023593047|nr:ribonuclease E/G [Ketogulonicigenium vulgare]